MAKYIIKESELRSIIKEIIEEELNEGKKWDAVKGAFQHGPVHALGKIALRTGKTVVSPLSTVNDMVIGLHNLEKGKTTIKGNLKDLWGRKVGDKKKDDNVIDAQDIKKGAVESFGIPEMKFGSPHTLADKREMKVPEGVGLIGGESLGEHYFEKDQDKSSSVWNRYIKELQNRAVTNNTKDEIEQWLKKRDKAYEKMAKTM